MKIKTEIRVVKRVERERRAAQQRRAAARSSAKAVEALKTQPQRPSASDTIAQWIDEYRDKRRGAEARALRELFSKAA